MSIVSIVKSVGPAIGVTNGANVQRVARPGISNLASSLPDEKKTEHSFLTRFLKWSKESPTGLFLFKLMSFGIQMTNVLAKRFSMDLGIDKLMEKELNKHLFRTDLADPLPPNIDMDSLVKLKGNPEPTLYGHFYENKNSKLLAIFLHGFGSTIFEDRSSCLKIQKELNTNVLCVDYRGYGLSEGIPTIDGVTNDVVRMYDYATQEKGFDGKDIVFVGVSIGGPIGLEAYSELKKQSKPLGGLVLIYPFSSVRDITKWRFPEAPIFLLPDDKFNAKKLAKQVSIPVHVAIGDQDKDTPNKQSKKVFENIPGSDKTLHVLKGIGHNNLGVSDHPSVNVYFSSLRDWLNKYFQKN